MIKITYLKDGKGSITFFHNKKVYAVYNEKGQVLWLNTMVKL